MRNWITGDNLRFITAAALGVASGGTVLLLTAFWQRRRQINEPEDEPMTLYANGVETFEGEPRHFELPSNMIEPNEMSPLPLVPQSLNCNVLNEELSGLPFGAVIHITNSYAELDLCYPWRVQNPNIAMGTGFCIGERRIMTNNHVISCGTSIRVMRHGKPGNYEARILVTSALCDLALVTVDDDEFWEGVPVCKLQDAVPELDDTVVAVGYPMGATTVTLTRGVVSNVHLKDLSLTELNEKQLTVQIDAAINPGNSGGPVFNQITHEVVGVAFATMKEAEGHGYIIPTPVLRNFMRVYEATGDFVALPSLGLRVQTLGNPSLRKRAFGGKPAHHNGVLIIGLAPFSCAKQAGVRVGDVLMSLDDNTVSEEKETVFRGHERVHYSHSYTQKGVGDTIRLSLLRRKEVDKEKGKEKGVEEEIDLETIELDVTLTVGKKLVPRELGKDYKPEYLIVGGLVLVVAGVPLAQQLEAKDSYGPRQQAVITAEQEADECDDEEAQVVIVSDCLAHELNVSYNMFLGSRLKEINGTAVRNLSHAASMIRAALDEQKPFVTLNFHKCKQMAVFETTALLAATPTILEQHKIPSWTSLPLELTPASKSLFGFRLA